MPLRLSFKIRLQRGPIDATVAKCHCYWRVLFLFNIMVKIPHKPWGQIPVFAQLVSSKMKFNSAVCSASPMHQIPQYEPTL